MPQLTIKGITLKVPVVQGGMGVGVSLHPLASAVAVEGGLGILSSALLDRLVTKPPTQTPHSPIFSYNRWLRQLILPKRALMNSHRHIHAVIFDMDGLMFDTERIAQKVWQQAAAEYSYIFPEETYRGVIGRKLPDVRRFIYQHFGADFPFDQVYHRKQRLLNIYIINQGIPVKPGLFELLEKIESRSLPLAVASSSGRQIILNNLSVAGIDASRFQAIVGGDEISKGKPAPDIFLARKIRGWDWGCPSTTRSSPPIEGRSR